MNQQSNHIPSKKKWLPIFVLTGLVLALFASEVTIRVSGVDWRYAEKNLFYQIEDVFNHVADPDPKLLYRLRPNSSYRYYWDHQNYSVSINSLGERGPERKSSKPANVYRIAVFGGSNVYGSHLNNNETWPARLEAELNRRFQSVRYEVWNFGTSAYVGTQMARLANEMIARIDPDLIIFALSNSGIMAFLSDTDIQSYFEHNPIFWNYLIDDSDDSIRPSQVKLWCLKHSHLYRYTLMVLAGIRNKNNLPLWHINRGFEQLNVQHIHELIEKHRSSIKFCYFVGPYNKPEPNPIASGSGYTIPRSYTEYFQIPDVPVLSIETTEAMPPEFSFVHPPSHVTPWYAERLTDLLKDTGLLAN